MNATNHIQIINANQKRSCMQPTPLPALKSLVVVFSEALPTHTTSTAAYAVATRLRRRVCAHWTCQCALNLRRASLFSSSIVFVSLLPLDNWRCLSSIIRDDLLVLHVSKSARKTKVSTLRLGRQSNCITTPAMPTLLACTSPSKVVHETWEVNEDGHDDLPNSHSRSLKAHNE